MNEYSYKQFSKSFVRRNALSYAVDILTSKRNESTCVPRDYVRRIFNFYTLNEDESSIKSECLKIEPEYILEWEHLYDSTVSRKCPSDLSVCYLCGPEPNNDFLELTSLGILPRNIWAFESNSATYKTAISCYENGDFQQPKILKQKIDTFFEQSQQKFDIVYIDACGSIASDQHALRCITSLIKNHRLCSPGVIISNFAEPDDKTDFYEFLAQFQFSKTSNDYTFSDSGSRIDSPEYRKIFNNTKKDFEKSYGEFISYIIRDLAGIYIPLQRMTENPYLSQLIDIAQVNSIDNLPLESFSELSSGRFISSYYHMKKNGYLNKRIVSLINEIELKEGEIAKAIKLLYAIHNSSCELKEDIKDIKNYLDNGSSLFQFLDKTDSAILFDIVLNQMSYPFHTNTKAVKRYRYCAKKTNMYTDVTVLDECRYIYDWLPALHQIKSAFSNPSWQYIFRFALDGLIKSRYNYNNEFFYKGAVVPSSEEGFENITMKEREIIK